jgi:hypothetical protein
MGWFIAAGLVFLGIVGAVTALVPSKPATPVEEPMEEPVGEPVEQPAQTDREEEDADAERAR